MSAREWTTDMPDKCGLWQIKCMETDGEPEFVAITKRKGWFIVHSDALCETPLKAYHDGLINLHWKFIA